MKRALPVPFLLLVAACNAAPGAGTDAGSGGGADTGSGAAVTYYGDVRPILADHCVGCHVVGGIAPIPLDTYDAAAPAAPLIESYTSTRRMPPFLADNSGTCQQFETNDWLSDADLATLAAWNAQGAPEGDPSTPAPTPRQLAHLSGSDVHTLDIGVDYEPTSRFGSDDYHCFVVTPPMGGFITGAEVHPDATRMVHHVIVYAPADQQGVDEVMAADAAEAGPGYTCFGGGGSDHALPVVLWAPGAGAVHTPRGTGLQIDGSRPLVIQVHYNLLNAQPGDTDRSTVDVQIANAATPAFFLPIADLGLVAPPHMSATTHSYDMPFGQIWLRDFGVSSAHVYSIGPHMHTLGTDIQVDVLNDDGSTDCLVHIPRWDFNWQLAYRYQTPIPITDTTNMRITCTWDTSSRDTTVTWGEGTQDEMCLAFLYVSI